MAGLDILKSALQQAQLEYFMTINRIIDEHACTPAPVLQKKGVLEKVFNKKETVPLLAPLPQPWQYQHPSTSFPMPNQAGNAFSVEKMNHLIEVTRVEAMNKIKKGDQLSEVLLYLNSLQQKVNQR